jgi:pyruvate/2-oxoglutarate dehydrogenase complex dihydrolipoamide acyltransferase (E2) component
MSKRWKVNEGTQVDVGGKIRTGGDEFTATDDELDEFGSRQYVTEVRQQAAPKAENKAQAAPKPHSAAKDTGRS